VLVCKQLGLVLSIFEMVLAADKRTDRFTQPVVYSAT